VAVRYPRGSCPRGSERPEAPAAAAGAGQSRGSARRGAGCRHSSGLGQSRQRWEHGRLGWMPLVVPAGL